MTTARLSPLDCTCFRVRGAARRVTQIYGRHLAPTGLKVRISGPLDSIEYTFVQSGRRIHKTVHYFLMDPIGGDLARHDHEFDEVCWIRFDAAPTMLTFETERVLVARTAAELAGSGTAPGAASSDVPPTGAASAEAAS